MQLEVWRVNIENRYSMSKITDLKIAFIGEAVSGFGGMETVIRDVITTFRQQHIQSEMFFFCRNDKMDKGWLEGIKYSCSFSNIRLGFCVARNIFKL